MFKLKVSFVLLVAVAKGWLLSRNAKPRSGSDSLKLSTLSCNKVPKEVFCKYLVTYWKIQTLQN